MVLFHYRRQPKVPLSSQPLLGPGPSHRGCTLIGILTTSILTRPE